MHRYSPIRLDLSRSFDQSFDVPFTPFMHTEFKCESGNEGDNRPMSHFAAADICNAIGFIRDKYSLFALYALIRNYTGISITLVHHIYKQT